MDGNSWLSRLSLVRNVTACGIMLSLFLICMGMLSVSDVKMLCGLTWSVCVCVAGSIDGAVGQLVVVVLLRGEERTRRHGGASGGCGVHGGGAFAVGFRRSDAIPNLFGHHGGCCRWPSFQLAQLLQQAQPYPLAAMARFCHCWWPDGASSGVPISTLFVLNLPLHLSITIHPLPAGSSINELEVENVRFIMCS